MLNYSGYYETSEELNIYNIILANLKFIISD